MFNKAFIGASAFIASNVQASYVVGKCPRIKTDWQGAHPNENLDLTKLQGTWGAVWESYVRQIHSECVNIKLNPVENEPKKLQFVQGISFKEDDQVIFDDNMLLNFAHQSDSSQAAIEAHEELHGEITDAEAINGLESLNLPTLTQEQRDNLDINDIDIYERQQENFQLYKDLIADNIKKGNRFAYPFMVLDTDYENFLITYQCREEFRTPRETDFMLHEGEKYREVMEEYNSDSHDQFIADRFIANHEENEHFQKLQRKILEDNEKQELTDDDYNAEINELMNIDPFHHHHFNAHRPTIEQWKKRRTLYGDSSSLEDMDDAFNMEKEQWFNDNRISVYMRKPQAVDDRLDDIKKVLKERVPGFDFDSFHMNTIHDESTCLDGDIFSHSKAWRYSEIEKVERKNKHTEKDLMDGKMRQEDDENLDLEDNEINENGEGEENVDPEGQDASEKGTGEGDDQFYEGVDNDDPEYENEGMADEGEYDEANEENANEQEEGSGSDAGDAAEGDIEEEEVKEEL